MDSSEVSFLDQTLPPPPNVWRIGRDSEGAPSRPSTTTSTPIQRHPETTSSAASRAKARSRNLSNIKAAFADVSGIRSSAASLSATAIAADGRLSRAGDKSSESSDPDVVECSPCTTSSKKRLLQVVPRSGKKENVQSVNPNVELEMSKTRRQTKEFAISSETGNRGRRHYQKNTAKNLDDWLRLKAQKKGNKVSAKTALWSAISPDVATAKVRSSVPEVVKSTAVRSDVLDSGTHLCQSPLSMTKALSPLIQKVVDDEDSLSSVVFMPSEAPAKDEVASSGFAEDSLPEVGASSPAQKLRLQKCDADSQSPGSDTSARRLESRSPSVQLCSPSSPLREVTNSRSPMKVAGTTSPVVSQHTRQLRAIFGSPSFRARYERVKEHDLNRFAPNQVVRNKEDRKLLHGFDCPCCAPYYNALGLDANAREARLNQVSRHRGLEQMPSTPEHYWEVGMADREEQRRRGQLAETESPYAVQPRSSLYRQIPQRKLFH